MQVQALDRLRRIRLAIIAESYEGMTQIVREDPECDALTFFEPNRVYDQEFLIEVDTMRPLEEVLFENADGMVISLQEAFTTMLKRVDEARKR